LINVKLPETIAKKGSCYSTIIALATTLKEANAGRPFNEILRHYYGIYSCHVLQVESEISEPRDLCREAAEELEHENS